MRHNDFARLRQALFASVLEGKGSATAEQRRAAFSNAGLAEPLNTLIDKVANRSQTIRDEDIRAAKESGLSEDQIFEAIVCGAIGEAARQYDAALRTLASVAD
jgi:hypothetical protein